MLIGKDPFVGRETFTPCFFHEILHPPTANIPRGTMGSTSKFVETIAPDSVIKRGVVRPSARDTETSLSVEARGLKGWVAPESKSPHSSSCGDPILASRTQSLDAFLDLISC